MLRIDRTLQAVMLETAKTSALVFIILIGAAMLTAAFRAFGGEELVREFLTELPGGFWTQFAIVMLVMFILGFFIDFIEIAVVVVPIVSPILLLDPEANVTAVWLGVMYGMNIQTSFLTPPFGFALFYLRGVASAAVKTIQIYRGVIPFILLQLLALGITALFPELVNYLPNRTSLTSATAPPPVNPRLQHCIEEYIFEQYDENGGSYAAAIAEAQSLPYSLLPRNLHRDVKEALEKAAAVPQLLAAIRAAGAEVAEQAISYRPLHADVRTLQSEIGRLENHIAVTETELSRAPPDAEERRQNLENELADLQRERQALLDAIPADWDQRHDAFLVLVEAEEKARQDYRRTVDQAYRPVQELLTLLRATPAYAALAGDFETVEAAVGARDEAVEDAIGELLRTLEEAEADDEVTDALSDLRREVRKDTVDWSKASRIVTEARQVYEEELAWREAALADVEPGLGRYEATVRDTIGLRQQPRLPEDIAIEIAECSSDHRDVSLSF
jgi:hypothetical protein